MPDGNAAAAGIASDPEYQAAYGGQPNYEDIGRALAAFERVAAQEPELQLGGGRTERHTLQPAADNSALVGRVYGQH